MLSKLLKNDLKKNMRWMWILFVSTIGVAIITRGTKELGENIGFFKLVYVFFEGVFYGLAANLIIQPFLRNFLNFYRSFYSDEAYLTHTLPVTKNQLINSKYLTAAIELLAGFATLIVSILVIYAGPGFIKSIELLISMLITGKCSVLLVVVLIVILVIVEFLMFISIIDFSIVIAFRQKERRILKAFLISIACEFAALIALAVVMFVVLLVNNVNITSSTLILTSSVFYSVILTGIFVYLAVIVLFYFITKREFNKGVNID